MLRTLRERESLASELGIDPVQIGRKLDSAEPVQAFHTMIRKIEQIRLISSPVYKLIKLSQVMTEIMNLYCSDDCVQEADNIL
jgi:hypothetical protein